MTEAFNGAKVAILVGNQIVTILRDDIPSIPWPGFWDLPGGGRENNETPVETVLRELFEELGLVRAPEDLVWSLKAQSGDQQNWFFVTEWPDFRRELVQFGDEGAAWKLAPIEWFQTDPRVIPMFQDRLKKYFEFREML